MTLWQYFIMLVTMVLSSVGQVLFKIAAGKIDIVNKGLFGGLIFVPSLIIAFLVYGIAVVSWLFVLKSMPLKVAYTFSALTFIMVPVLASIFLGESLELRNFIGAVVIILGVYVSLA